MAKKRELGLRKAELAERIRDAYEAERTSLLETFLSGASFTDMLAEMSSQLDAADQDRELAAQVAEGPRDAAEPARDGRRDARGDEHDPPGDGGPEAEARPAAEGAPRGAGAPEGAREAGRGRAPGAASPVRARWPPTRSGCATRSRRRRPPSAQLQKQDQPPGREAVQPGQHPVPVQRDAALADGRRRDPGLRLHRRGLRAADGRLRPLAQRHRHRRPVRDAGSRVGCGQRRVRRLELCRRRRPGVDRDHRPLQAA